MNIPSKLDPLKACMLIAMDDLDLWYPGGREFLISMMIEYGDGFNSKWCPILEECADVRAVSNCRVEYTQGDVYVMFVTTEHRYLIPQQRGVVLTYNHADAQGTATSSGHAVFTAVRNVIDYDHKTCIIVPKRGLIVEKRLLQ